MLRYTLKDKPNLNDLKSAILAYIHAKKTSDRLIITTNNLNNASQNLSTLSAFGIVFDEVIEPNKKAQFHLLEKLLNERKATEEGEEIKIKELKIAEKGVLERCFIDAIEDMILNISTSFYSENRCKQILKIYDSLDYKSPSKNIAPSKIIGGEITLEEIIEGGILPSAVLEFIFDIELELEKIAIRSIMTQLQTMEIKDETRKFDLKILKTINKRHLQNLKPLDLAALLGVMMDFNSSKNDERILENLGEIGRVLASEIDNLNDLKIAVARVFAPKDLRRHKDKKVIEEIIEEIKNCKDKELQDLIKKIEKERSLKAEKIRELLGVIFGAKYEALAAMWQDLQDFYPLIFQNIILKSKTKEIYGHTNPINSNN